MQIISFKGTTQHANNATPAKVDQPKDQQQETSHPSFPGLKGREQLKHDVFTPQKPSK